jgi:hypothetical protein
VIGTSGRRVCAVSANTPHGRTHTKPRAMSCSAGTQRYSFSITPTTVTLIACPTARFSRHAALATECASTHGATVSRNAAAAGPTSHSIVQRDKSDPNAVDSPSLHRRRQPCPRRPGHHEFGYREGCLVSPYESIAQTDLRYGKGTLGEGKCTLKAPEEGTRPTCRVAPSIACAAGRGRRHPALPYRPRLRK